MKFLIVSLRYLGDCLLAAALAPALKARFPDAQIDMLTFKDNAPILEGIQDISHVIGVEHHPNKFVQACSHLASWNKYDWALITMNSTRTVLLWLLCSKASSDGASVSISRGTLETNSDYRSNRFCRRPNP